MQPRPTHHRYMCKISAKTVVQAAGCVSEWIIYGVPILYTVPVEECIFRDVFTYPTIFFEI